MVYFIRYLMSLWIVPPDLICSPLQIDSAFQAHCVTTFWRYFILIFTVTIVFWSREGNKICISRYQEILYFQDLALPPQWLFNDLLVAQCSDTNICYGGTHVHSGLSWACWQTRSDNLGHSRPSHVWLPGFLSHLMRLIAFDFPFCCFLATKYQFDPLPTNHTSGAQTMH